MVLRSSPTGGSNDLKRLYLLAIAAARRTLDICSPYFVTDESSDWALAEARRRGVRVRILVEGDLTDAKPVKYAGRHAYQRLMDQGIEIYEYQPTMMHTKTIVVDGGVEHVRLGELRQPIAGTERRDERRRSAIPASRRGCWRTSSRICARAKKLDPAPGGSARSCRSRASTSGATSGRFSEGDGDRGTGTKGAGAWW